MLTIFFIPELAKTKLNGRIRLREIFLAGRSKLWQKEGNMMPLSMAPIGEPVTIKKITGKDEIRLHLAELGFVVDSDVTVVSENGGSLIIQVKESRIALGVSMANRIMI